MSVAIIPARGGSRRIPRKNIKHFAGKPIIGWSIEAAKASECFDHIVVSTDDAEIAEVARAFGAITPFERPAELASDTAATLPVIAHAVGWLGENGFSADHACCIYPTAPLLQPSDLRSGYERLVGSDADYVVSCCAYEFPVQRSVEIGSDGFLDAAFPESINARSQDLKPLYHDAGQFYWGKAEAFAAQRPFFMGRALPLLIPRLRVQDIDDEEDWQRAEFLFHWINREANGNQ